jgi:riboflavin synthase
MFTGIVRERGRVESSENGRLIVEAPETARGATVGDSVSIDGVCLTAVDVTNGRISFDLAVETRARAKQAEAGAAVNVEPALRAGDALGGHYVQGHVDAVGTVRSSEPEGEGLRVWIDALPEVLRYCVEKGSITVDGVSLTIAELADDAFAVALVPHTLEVTTLGDLGTGDQVNLEVDVLAKYVEKLARA